MCKVQIKVQSAKKKNKKKTDFVCFLPFSDTWPMSPAVQSQMNRFPFTSQFSRQEPPLRHGWSAQQRLVHWLQGDCAAAFWLVQENI